MNKFLRFASIFVAGALCGLVFQAPVADNSPIPAQFDCADYESDNWAEITFDDVHNRASYNPRGHWNPGMTYWQNSIMHNDQFVIWEVPRCTNGLAHQNIASFEAMVTCGDEELIQTSEIWLFERTAQQLSRFTWTEDGGLARFDQYCNDRWP